MVEYVKYCEGVKKRYVRSEERNCSGRKGEVKEKRRGL